MAGAPIHRQVLQHAGQIAQRRGVEASPAVAARFDHRDLNGDTPYFEKAPPTAENLAQVIFGLLDRAFPGGLLERVRLHEGPDHFVDVERGEAP